MQPVVKPVWQPVRQPFVSCIQTFNRLNNRLFNRWAVWQPRLNNRLRCVNKHPTGCIVPPEHCEWYEGKISSKDPLPCWRGIHSDDALTCSYILTHIKNLQIVLIILVSRHCWSRTGIPNQREFSQKKISWFQLELGPHIGTFQLLEYSTFSRLRWNNSIRCLAMPKTQRRADAISRITHKGSDLWGTLESRIIHVSLHNIPYYTWNPTFESDNLGKGERTTYWPMPKGCMRKKVGNH